MSGETMAHKVISKVNARLKFLLHKNKYLTPNLHCLLYNAFDLTSFWLCLYSVWYPIFFKIWKTKFKLHRINASVCFCLQLDKATHIPQKEFETINWLSIKEFSCSLRNNHKKFKSHSIKLAWVKVPYTLLAMLCRIKFSQEIKITTSLTHPSITFRNNISMKLATQVFKNYLSLSLIL